MNAEGFRNRWTFSSHQNRISALLTEIGRGRKKLNELHEIEIPCSCIFHVLANSMFLQEHVKFKTLFAQSCLGTIIVMISVCYCSFLQLPTTSIFSVYLNLFFVDTELRHFFTISTTVIGPWAGLEPALHITTLQRNSIVGMRAHRSCAVGLLLRATCQESERERAKKTRLQRLPLATAYSNNQ